MSTADMAESCCFLCDMVVTGKAYDPKICVSIDRGDGEVGSLVVCQACGPLAPSTGDSTIGAQTFLDSFARQIRRVSARGLA